MKEDNLISLEKQIFEQNKTDLELILQEGARRMLQAAIENEVAEYIEKFKQLRDSQGKRLVVRNGFHTERDIVSGIGPLKVKQPRINDKRPGKQFSSTILPAYMRRVPSVDNLIPVLYLKGISTGDFSTALRSILGDNVSGLSATNIVKLKKSWEDDYKAWRERDLSLKRYVYLWVDGIYFNVRLESEDNNKQCILVVIGTTEDGNKELVAIMDGYRESKLTWLDILRDLKRRGLTTSPKLAIGDGALGFWSALREEFPETKEQRCWVHKTANILDKMPKSVQPRAKEKIHEMYLSPTKEEALKAYEEFNSLYESKYENACKCLQKDKENLFMFYDFPAEHWKHIRTTNPIESTFATVRLRTKRTKGCGSRIATLTMVYKLILEAEKRWQRIRGYKLIPLVMKGVKFKDGERVEEEVA
jgi:transposase-like protein